ncbi:hypothetical protein B5S32_g4826 [[Candida] boidinii]|nr:hypothetical protein B5S32_g4826 [[Candida] boidinii]
MFKFFWPFFQPSAPALTIPNYLPGDQEDSIDLQIKSLIYMYRKYKINDFAPFLKCNEVGYYQFSYRDLNNRSKLSLSSIHKNGKIKIRHNSQKISNSNSISSLNNSSSNISTSDSESDFETSDNFDDHDNDEDEGTNIIINDKLDIIYNKSQFEEIMIHDPYRILIDYTKNKYRSMLILSDLPKEAKNLPKFNDPTFEFLVLRPESTDEEYINILLNKSNIYCEHKINYQRKFEILNNILNNQRRFLINPLDKFNKNDRSKIIKLFVQKLAFHVQVERIFKATLKTKDPLIFNSLNHNNTDNLSVNRSTSDLKINIPPQHQQQPVSTKRQSVSFQVSNKSSNSIKTNLINSSFPILESEDTPSPPPTTTSTPTPILPKISSTTQILSSQSVTLLNSSNDKPPSTKNFRTKSLALFPSSSVRYSSPSKRSRRDSQVSDTESTISLPMFRFHNSNKAIRDNLNLISNTENNVFEPSQPPIPNLHPDSSLQPSPIIGTPRSSIRPYSSLSQYNNTQRTTDDTRSHSSINLVKDSELSNDHNISQIPPKVLRRQSILSSPTKPPLSPLPQTPSSPMRSLREKPSLSIIRVDTEYQESPDCSTGDVSFDQSHGGVISTIPITFTKLVNETSQSPIISDSNTSNDNTNNTETTNTTTSSFHEVNDTFKSDILNGNGQQQQQPEQQEQQFDSDDELSSVLSGFDSNSEYSESPSNYNKTSRNKTYRNSHDSSISHDSSSRNSASSFIYNTTRSSDNFHQQQALQSQSQAQQAHQPHQPHQQSLRPQQPQQNSYSQPTKNSKQNQFRSFISSDEKQRIYDQSRLAVRVRIEREKSLLQRKF